MASATDEKEKPTCRSIYIERCAVFPGTYPPGNGFETGRIRVLWNGSDTWVEWSQRNHTASDAATRP